MKLNQNNQNIFLHAAAPKGSPTFGGLSSKIPTSLDEIKKIKRIVDCNANNLLSDTVRRIPSTYLTRKGTDAENILLPTFMPKWHDFVESFIDIGRMPRGIATSVIQNLRNKFPKSRFIRQLAIAPFVQRHMHVVNLKNNLGTLNGIYENGAELLKKAGSSSALCKCSIEESACEGVSKGFDKLLNDSMEWAKPKYDTKYERFWTRLVSGFTAASFLGKDFFNKAKMNNKDDKEAKQAAREKMNQEVLATTGEAISQFAFLATFAQLANTKTWLAPIVSAFIGLTFNIVSRIALGRKLTRIETPNSTVQFGTAPKIEDFLQNAKNSKEQTNINLPVKEKRRLLTLKNILIATGASIVTGFALKAGVRTKTFQNLKKVFDDTGFGGRINKLRASAYEEMITNRREMQEASNAFHQIGESELGRRIKSDIPKFQSEHGIYLGRRAKTTKLFGKVEVPVSSLYQLPLIPLRFFKELIMYPYKMVNSFAQSTARGVLQKQGIDLEQVKPEQIQKRFSRFCAKIVDNSPAARKKDATDLENIFFRFREFKAKYPNPDEFEKEFGKYVKNMRKISVNSTTASKINNEKLAVPAQILGMLSGIAFNMNDDYNKTIELGGTEQQAQKDARLRGTNKFTRVAVQATVAGTLNSLLAKQYSSSLLKAALITAGATVLTDTVCRILTGMPFKRMNKEELIKDKEKREKGLSQEYFRVIDKVVS